MGVSRLSRNRGDHESPAKKMRFPIVVVAILLCSVAALSSLYLDTHELTSYLPTSWQTINKLDTSTAPSALMNITSSLLQEASPNVQEEADFIIRKSYAETYSRMASCDDDDIEKKCIAKVAKQFRDQAEQGETPGMAPNATNISVDHPIPWWFQTLLRDVPSNGAYGFWHHFSTSNPPFKFCAIGKNGSTEWRRIFRLLNEPERCTTDPSTGKTLKCADQAVWNTKAELSEDTPNAVFLRDPLERLLSGYLDKCVKPVERRTQGHCEPNIVFGLDRIEAMEIFRSRQKNESEAPTKHQVLTNEIDDLDKEMFAMYVDLMPLKWNVHFVPQAIFCDLYRKIQNYEFVGKMGKDFMQELDRMANHFGGLVPDSLDKQFNYRSFLINNTVKHDNTGSPNQHATHAPTKVARYYSARAVRRALEYFSIDYVTLGLEVPGWAKDILRQDAIQ